MREYQLNEGIFFRSKEEKMRDKVNKELKKSQELASKKANKLRGELYDPVITKTLITESIKLLQDGEFENAASRWKNIKQSIVGYFNAFKSRMPSNVLTLINDLDRRYDWGGQLLGIIGGDDDYSRNIRDKKDALIRELSNLLNILPNTSMDKDGNEVSDLVLNIFAKNYIEKEWNAKDIVGRKVIDNFKNAYL